MLPVPDQAAIDERKHWAVGALSGPRSKGPYNKPNFQKGNPPVMKELS